MERSFPRPFDLHRHRYRHGQLLRSRDLRTQLGDEAQLRWWHNRALHNAFGVVHGLTWTAMPGGPATVAPGLAYDAFGRELLLRAELSVPIPQGVALNTLSLLARYPEDSDVAGQAEVVAACLPTCPPGMESPFTLVWKRTCEVHLRDGVPLPGGFSGLPSLAQVVDSIGPPAAVDWSRQPAEEAAYTSSTAAGRPLIWMPVQSDKEPAARSASSFLSMPATGRHELPPQCVTPITRPLERSRIGRGSTFPGTAWDIWKITIGSDELPVGIQVFVDTVAAGFTTAPCYFAWLQWPDFSALDRTLLSALATAVTYVTDSTNDGFVFRLLMPDKAIEAANQRREGQRNEEAMRQKRSMRSEVSALRQGGFSEGNGDHVSIELSAALRRDLERVVSKGEEEPLLTVHLALTIATRDMLAFTEEARPALCWLGIEDDRCAAGQ